MKLICKAQNYGLNRNATGFLQIINNYKDIHNFKNGGIALFNHHFLNGAFLKTDQVLLLSVNNKLQKIYIGVPT